jgi:DNA-binding CsgD family transcriptional regulator
VGTFFPVQPQVVGREAELAEVESFLDGAADGLACLALEGEPGIGKTTLWQEGVRRAEERGWNVLQSRPAASEARFSFAGLGDLLARIPRKAFTALPEPQRRALDVALLRRRSRGAPPDQRTISIAVLSTIQLLASSSPVLLAVDDAQWLDDSTASALAFASRRLADRAVAVLAAVRLGGGRQWSFDRAVDESRRRVLRVGPLSLGSLHRLIRDRLGATFTRPTLVRIASASGGNPFYALEIARELVGAGEPRAGAPLPVPGDLRDLVSSRVRRLPVETREALLIASALTHPTTEQVDERALAAGEEADIVRVDGDGRIVFSHPLFASAVYDTASGARRRTLHARLAEQVEDAEERARHLALATARPDERVAQTLDEGAARARSRGAWESAAELLERARELTPPDGAELARRRGVQAAEHHCHAGDRRRARTLLEEILAGTPDGPARGEALRLLAEIRYNEESFAEALPLYEEALVHTVDPGSAVTIELGLSYTHANLWDFPAGVARAQHALDRATRIGDDALVSEALAYCAMLDYLLGRGVDWGKVDRSLALEDPSRVLPLQARPSCVAALLLTYVGRFSEGRERLLALRSRAVEQGDESDLGLVLLWLAWIESVTGRFVAAIELAEEMLLITAVTGTATSHAWALTQRAFANAHRGEVAQTRRDCAEALALSQRTGYLLPRIWIAAALGMLELSLGDPAAAWQAVAPVTQAVEQHGVGEPVAAYFLPESLEALIALGELDRAESLLDAFEGKARELDRVWALATGGRCRGLLLAARGELAAAEAAFDAALAAHERIEMPFERARTLLALGRVQRRRKQRAAARRTLAEALETFETLGAAIWAERAREELERTHVRQAPGELTPTERRVAELAAAGLTNQKIAETLFVSPKTVEANLARAYRKLGVHSRAQLGATMAAEGAVQQT